MRVLFIYPGLNPQVNDIALILPELVRLGAEVQVVTARENPSKAVEVSPAFEEWQGIRIHRPYARFAQMVWRPAAAEEECRRIIEDLDPQLIVASQELTMRVALQCAARSGAVRGGTPIVLVTEFAGELAKGRGVGRRVQALWPLLGVPAWRTRFWPWLSRQCAAIITANPADVLRLKELSASGAPVYHVPWCNALPDYQPAPERDPGRAAYIGTFSEFKNTAELAHSVPALLEQSPLERFTLVGGGDTAVVRQLQARYGERIEHLPGLPRKEALELLSGCYFGHTPVRVGGWGFIGDCWATGTPLVALHNAYNLRPRVDGLLPEKADLATVVRELYAQPDLYLRLQEGGRQRHGAHTASAVGRGYYDVLQGVVSPHAAPQAREPLMPGG